MTVTFFFIVQETIVLLKTNIINATGYAVVDWGYKSVYACVSTSKDNKYPQQQTMRKIQTYAITCMCRGRLDYTAFEYACI